MDSKFIVFISATGEVVLQWKLVTYIYMNISIALILLFVGGDSLLQQMGSQIKGS